MIFGDILRVLPRYIYGVDFKVSILRTIWSDKTFNQNKFRNCDCNVTTQFIPTPETKGITQTENDHQSVTFFVLLKCESYKLNLP